MRPSRLFALVALGSVAVALLIGASPVHATKGRGAIEARGGAHHGVYYVQPRHRPPVTKPRLKLGARARAQAISTPTATVAMTGAAEPTKIMSAESGLAGWLTTKDARRRVSRLSLAELVPSAARSAVHVAVDDTQRFQTMDGYGAALTESSAHLLMRLSATKRTAALRSLFDPVDGAGLDLVRLPLGASDFSLSRYTYDDLPAGQTDPGLIRFSLAHDDVSIIPVLREALAINPRLRVMGTPWSPPAWMKTSGSLIGGTLRSDSVDVYARYLVKTVQALRTRRVPIRFLTLGNEPKYAPPDYPGMLMSATQEAALASTLHARLVAAGITDVRLIGYDHNWDDTTYPTILLADPTAAAALAGTAFHCYGGQPSAQSVVREAALTKGIWFTECSGGNWSTSYATNLGWDADTLLLGATRILGPKRAPVEPGALAHRRPTHGRLQRLPRCPHHRPRHRQRDPQRGVRRARARWQGCATRRGSGSHPGVGVRREDRRLPQHRRHPCPHGVQQLGNRPTARRRPSWPRRRSPLPASSVVTLRW